MWDWNLPANHVKAWDFLPHFLFRSYHSSYPHWVHWLKSKLAAILKRFCCHSNYSYAYFRCSFWFLKSCYIPDSYILTKYQCTRFWIWSVCFLLFKKLYGASLSLIANSEKCFWAPDENRTCNLLISRETLYNHWATCRTGYLLELLAYEHKSNMN